VTGSSKGAVTDVDAAASAILAGRLAVIPTDTVYGLAASPHDEAPVRRLYRAKGRKELQPTALVAADVDRLLDYVPELRGRPARIARMLLPGPYTLVLANPGRRFRWLNGASPEAIGVRVPDLEGVAKELLERVGAVAATSANLPGGPDPRRVEDVPEQIRAAAVVLDGGELPGTASTVLDFTGAEPRVLREGAAPSAEALRSVSSVL
jgi:L-threonylcarbamoyladenylate synthase